MTLENLVVIGGIILGFWSIGVVTLLAVGPLHRTVLLLGTPRGAREVSRPAAERGTWTRRFRHAFGQR